ncbi:MAG: RDD family protein [Bdellovibrionales bacterium]|nr:RDD family protein [Bdellovibrionales bacterium]
MKRAHYIHRFGAKAIDLGPFLFFYGDLSFFWLLLAGAYIACADGLFKGQSIGKRIVGLRTLEIIDPVDHKTQACSYLASAIRNSPFVLMLFLGKIPLLNILFWLVGGLFVLVEMYFIYTDEESTRIGDIYAKTQVVEADHY